MLVLLVALSLYAWAGGPGLVPAQLRAPSLATLFYVANWQQIVAGHGYFARFLSVSPLQQTWSLAIEEQYYLVWPLVILAITAVARAAGHRDPARLLLGVTVALAVASAVWMGVAAHVLGPNRAYLGTDTRAWELLLGGAAAMIWPPGSRRRRRPAAAVVDPRRARARRAGARGGAGRRPALRGSGTAGWSPSPPAPCWSFWVRARPRRAWSAALLAVGPLRWLGLISYSLYLWHWPVIVLMTPDTRAGPDGRCWLARLGDDGGALVCQLLSGRAPAPAGRLGGAAPQAPCPVFGFAALGIAVTAVIILAGTVGPPPARTAQVAVTPVGRATRRRDGGPRVRLGCRARLLGQPYQAWIFGDSVMVDSSPGITAALQATGDVSVTVNTAFPGWGLTTDHSWLSGGAADPGPATRLQIAIGTWSWDDQVAHEPTPPATGPCSTQYMPALLAPPDGVKLVVLVQFPQVGPSDSISDPVAREQAWKAETDATDAWDDAARQVVASFPGPGAVPDHAAALRSGRAVLDLDADPDWYLGPGPKARQHAHVSLWRRAVRRAGDRRADAGPPPGHAQAGVGVRIMDGGSPLQRSARGLPGRPAAGRLPRPSCSGSEGKERVTSAWTGMDAREWAWTRARLCAKFGGTQTSYGVANLARPVLA